MTTECARYSEFGRMTAECSRYSGDFRGGFWANDYRIFPVFGGVSTNDYRINCPKVPEKSALYAKVPTFGGVWTND
jgi:hypothetical protein